LSCASAIPPLRHLWTSAAPREECSKEEGDAPSVERVASKAEGCDDAPPPIEERWIPACAGMTAAFAGMTASCRGQPDRDGLNPHPALSRREREGGGKPRFNYVTGQAPPLRPRSKDGGSRRDAAPTEGRDRGVLDPRFRGDDAKARGRHQDGHGMPAPQRVSS